LLGVGRVIPFSFARRLPFPDIPSPPPPPRVFFSPRTFLSSTIPFRVWPAIFTVFERGGGFKRGFFLLAELTLLLRPIPSYAGSLFRQSHIPRRCRSLRFCEAKAFYGDLFSPPTGVSRPFLWYDHAWGGFADSACDLWRPFLWSNSAPGGGLNPVQDRPSYVWGDPEPLPSFM